VKYLTSGALTARTTKRGMYSGTLQTGNRRFSFSGQLDPSGSATKTITRKGENSLTISLQVQSGDNSIMGGTVGDGSWLAEFTAYRALFNQRTNPAPAAGKYTVVVPGAGDGSTQTPQGDGFGTVNVNLSGQVKFSGALAEGTKVTQSASLSQNGQWPCFIPLSQGSGQLIGWLNFTTVPSKDLGGQLNWIKLPNSRTRVYPSGFEFEPMARGSAYQPPAKNTPVLNFSDGQVALTGGNLAEVLINHIILNTNNKVTNLSSNKLSLTLAPSSGLFKGTVLNQTDGTSISFRGAVLQDENSGSGYFLRTNQSGRVFLGPR